MTREEFRTEARNTQAMQLIVNWVGRSIKNSGYWEEKITVRNWDNVHVVVYLKKMDASNHQLMEDVMKGIWFEEVRIEGDKCIARIPGAIRNFACGVVDEIHSKLFNDTL